MKKAKLLTSLLSIGLIGTSIPVVSTSCSNNEDTKPSEFKVNVSSNNVSIPTDESSEQITISATLNNEKVKLVKAEFAFTVDNVATATFSSGDEESSTILIKRETQNTSSTKLTITAYDVNNNHTTVDVTINIVKPQEIDISTLNWVTRIEYGTNNVENLKTKIKKDNANVFTAWNFVTFDVTVEGTNISVSIVGNSNAICTGSKAWNATYARNYITYDGGLVQLQDEINPNAFCTSWVSNGSGYYLKMTLPLKDAPSLTLIQGNDGSSSHTDFEKLTEIDLKACDESITTINDSFLDMDPEYGSYSNTTPFSKLTTIDLSGLNKITKIGRWFMFGCSSLTSLDLSVLKGLEGSHLSPVVGYTFACYCNALNTIKFGNLQASTFTQDKYSGSVYYNNSISFAKCFDTAPGTYSTTISGSYTDGFISRYGQLNGSTILGITYYRNLVQ